MSLFLAVSKSVLWVSCLFFVFFFLSKALYVNPQKDIPIPILRVGTVFIASRLKFPSNKTDAALPLLAP